ncbi:MAG: hypothetical protein GXY06_06620 [Clostridiaceae bacterium]|nr:hypothetical protein [Clostridiaceae bacterium]
MNPPDSHPFDMKKTGSGKITVTDLGAPDSIDSNPVLTKVAPDVSDSPPPKHARLKLVLGWLGVVITVIISVVWAYWGAIENFHEGWYSESITILKMFILRPFQVTMLVSHELSPSCLG